MKKLLWLTIFAAACAKHSDYKDLRAQQREMQDAIADEPPLVDVPATDEAEPDAAPSSGADEADDTSSDGSDAQRAIAVTSVTVALDRSALVKPASLAVPSVRVRPSAFEAKPIATALAKTAETFALLASDGQRQILDAPSFKLLNVRSQGAFVLARKVVRSGRYTGGESALADDARASLRAWGVGEGEIGAVVSKRVYAQDGDDAGVAAPVLHRYKTFVERAIAGVPVVGHRAVITHATDGSFARALVVWPPLAASGHKLTSRLSDDAIADRTKLALAAHGIAGGTARLRYKYVPTLDANGDARLTLVVGARVKAPSGDGEQHEVDVAIDAE